MLKGALISKYAKFSNICNHIFFVLNFLIDPNRKVIHVTSLSVHPGVLDFEKTNIAVPEDIGVVQVTIIRTGGEDGKLVAKYRTVDGTARTGTDYTPIEGEIEFQEGEIRQTVTINIVDDNTKEPLETFQVQIFTDDPRARRSTTITVIDNDGRLACYFSSVGLVSGEYAHDVHSDVTVRRKTRPTF